MQVVLSADDEEGMRGFNLIETSEVKVASIKHIARKRLVCKPVHRVDVMNSCVGDSVEYRNLCCNVNLRMNLDARFCRTELCPPEHRHAKVDCCRVNSVESSMQFKLLRDALGLGNRHHVESKLFKDSMISEKVRFGKHLTVDWHSAQTKKDGFSTMSRSYICKFPETSASKKLSKHKNQHVVPMGQAPLLRPIIVLGYYTSELPLRKELYYLREYESTYMHFCSDFNSDAKLLISKPGQHIRNVKCCA